MNSVLNLSALTSLVSMSDIWHAEALAGGTLNLSGLAAIDQPNENVQLEANGSASQLNLSALTSFTGGGGSSTFVVTGSGVVVDPNLTSFSNVAITTDPTVSFTVPPGQTFSFPSGTTKINTGRCSIRAP